MLGSKWGHNGSLVSYSLSLKYILQETKHILLQFGEKTHFSMLCLNYQIFTSLLPILQSVA